MIITTKNHIVKSRSEFLNVFVVMALTSLAFLTMVRALTIDNQLAVIKNDCYERMAIGQRLSPKDVYKTSNVNTVLNCQMTCTQEQSLCKSFSFGIGVKGNATCELSTDPVKETPDLKPIGTIADTDFDLYIKKLDCTLVIDKNHPHDHYGGEPPTLTSKPPISPGGSDSYGSPQHHVEIQRPGYESNQNNKPHQTVGYDRPHEDHHYGKPQVFEKPFPGDYDRPQNQNKPHQSIGYDRPEDYHIGKPQVFEKPPSGGYDGPQNQNHDQNRPPGDSVEHVQTLVSVSTGGQRPILHPVHEILIGEAAYNYAYPKPPFRPDFLNQPYHKPSRPEHDYHHFSRPGLHDKPNYYDYFDKYGPDYPYYSYQHPRPDDFDNPNYFEPIGAGYPDKFERPHRPSRPNTDYLFNQDPDNRPSRPQNSPGNYLSNQDPDSRPSRPQNNLENRPTKPGESAGYGDNSDSKPGANYDSAKPDRPQHDPNNPNTGSYQNKRPNDQTSYDSSIVNSINNGPSKPKDPHSKKPIVTQSVGPYGERITSIITELTQGK